VTRRGLSVEDDARWVFNRLAQDYRCRPPYPAALVDRLVALAGGPGGRAADLGAGTGLLSLPLVRAGLRVHAVEPAREMLRLLEEGARAEGVPFAGASPPPSAHPEVSAGAAGGESRETSTATATSNCPVELVHAAAEDTGLPSGAFDLVVLADALQWVDPERAGREAARLLAPGGAVAVVEPRLGGTPFLDALAALLVAANPKSRRAPLPVARLLAAAGTAPLPVERFDHEVALAPDELDAVLRSLSLVGPALGPALLAELLADARALAKAHGGATWRREILLHAGLRTAAAGQSPMR
jgi:SAM-dependent methyltransferase